MSNARNKKRQPVKYSEYINVVNQFNQLLQVMQIAKKQREIIDEKLKELGYDSEEICNKWLYDHYPAEEQGKLFV